MADLILYNIQKLPTLPPIPAIDSFTKAEQQLHRSIRSRRKFQGVK
jgi:hypothetical protein